MDCAVKDGDGGDSYLRFHATACQLKRARAEQTLHTPSVSHCQPEYEGITNGAPLRPKRPTIRPQGPGRSRYILVSTDEKRPDEHHPD